MPTLNADITHGLPAGQLRVTPDYRYNRFTSNPRPDLLHADMRPESMGPGTGNAPYTTMGAGWALLPARAVGYVRRGAQSALAVLSPDRSQAVAVTQRDVSGVGDDRGVSVRVTNRTGPIIKLWKAGGKAARTSGAENLLTTFGSLAFGAPAAVASVVAETATAPFKTAGQAIESARGLIVFGLALGALVLVTSPTGRRVVRDVGKGTTKIAKTTADVFT